MPSSVREHLIFTSIMVFVMCLVMTIYNVIIHEGFSVDSLMNGMKLFPLTYVVAFILEWFVVGIIAMKLVNKFLKPSDPIIKRILITAFFFVTGMASLMSLYGAVITHGFSDNLFAIWKQNITMNYPMAYFVQVVIAGPLVRFIFGKICPAEQATN